MPAEMCVQRVWRDHSHRTCGKAARLEHNGEWYCETHHPPTRVAKDAAKDAQRNAEWEAVRAFNRRWRDIVAAREAVIQAAKEWGSAEEKDGESATDLALALVVLREAEQAK